LAKPPAGTNLIASTWLSGGSRGVAPGEPVPDQAPAHLKSRALIGLQLIKRWRNVLYSKRDRVNLRWPPSVLLSKLVADHTIAEQSRTDSF